MPDFSGRSKQDELMDDFALGADTIYPIMDELEVINKLLGGFQVFYDALNKLPLRDGLVVCDWGCGGGDSLRALARWARRKDIKLRLHGLDATPSAISYAREKASAFPEITFEEADVLKEPLNAGQYDIVISSLFSHHFPDEDWIRLVQKMLHCSRHAVIINDLHRHPFAYYSIGMLTSLFSRSEMVKHDSKVSVLRGFRKGELQGLLARAGIKNYTIRWMWAFRWQLIIYKS